jgi:alkylation response protein AidB-like acyl-CoA dehydrogenase
MQRPDIPAPTIATVGTRPFDLLNKPSIPYLSCGVETSTAPQTSFLLSEEREEFRRSVRGLLARISPEEEVRRLMATDDGYEADAWRRMAKELGLQGLAIPEEHGGSGYGYNELVLVFEEMGRTLVCAPFFSSVALAANALLVAGDDEASRRFLPGIASGETIATLALTEDGGRWDEPGVTLGASGDRLNGHKTYVIDGHVASLILVVARTEAGIGLFAVEGDAPGLERTQLVTMDQTRKQARLEFSDTPATPIGPPDVGWATVSRILDRAAVALAAEQAGGGARCLEMATDYANERIQFGRPIGSFQAVKHKLATLLTEVESAKSAAYYAGWAAAEADEEELPVAAPLAKAYCSEAFMHAAAENIQVHGGIGVTWEHPAHLYFKRAKTSELLLGDPAHHRELLARRLGI